MIILYLYIAVTVGILLGGFFSGAKVADEKMKSYDLGWKEGHKEGVDSLLDEDDPRRDYQDEEVGALQW